MRGINITNITRVPAFRHSPLRGLLCAALVVVMLWGGVGLYYFLKFSSIVDQRLDGELFHRSARIYAATPDRGSPSAAPPGKATRISFEGGDDAAGTAALMTTFFDVSRTRRRPVEFHDIPKMLITAVLVGEDRVFFRHFGLHPKRIVGAFVSNVKRRAISQGASTITQQLARNLFLSPEPTLRRKLSEALIAILLENRLTKEQIFTMYANEVYLGHRDSFAIHGFAEATKAYFGKDLKDLTLSEAAMLAGIIPAPNAYSPVHHPDRALARRNLILQGLLNSGEITQEQYDDARSEELKITPHLDSTEGHYVVDFIRDELLRDFKEHSLMTGALTVDTTVDLQLQKAAIDSVEAGLSVIEERLSRQGARGSKSAKVPSPQAGLIALDPRTGEIKAMVGGAHYAATQYNRVTRALRQPGSIFKPFVYAAALETAFEGYSQFDFNPYDGETPAPITPLTTLIDEPMVFNNPDKVYVPRNYLDQYHGVVTLRTAFHHSLNVPTVMLAERIGYDRVARLARRMGLSPRIRGYPSIALGAFEVTPLEIAGAYTAFANGGMRVQPRVLRQVLASDGKVLKKYEPETERVLRPEVAFLMTHLMEGVINQGTGAGVRARGFTLPAAGKTGTSRDGWFAGYTKDLLVIAWVGFDDGRDLNLQGSRSALPIWTEFMKKAYRLYPAQSVNRMRFTPPDGIDLLRIDAATLSLGDPDCGEYFEEAFITGTAPSTSCLDGSDLIQSVSSSK